MPVCTTLTKPFCDLVSPITQERMDEINQKVFWKRYPHQFGVGVRMAIILLPVEVLVALTATRIGSTYTDAFAKVPTLFSTAFKTHSLQEQLFTVAVVAPVIEEIGFRGVLYPLTKSSARRFLGDDRPEHKKYAIGFATVLTSVAFGAAHGHFAQMVGAGFSGMLYCHLTERSEGSIAGSIGAHATHNAIVVLVAAMVGAFLPG